MKFRNMSSAASVMDIMFQIESYYWELYFRIQDLKAKEDSLKQAQQLQSEFKIRIDAGSLAPIEIYQADANVAQREQEVIVAQATVKAGRGQPERSSQPV